MRYFVTGGTGFIGGVLVRQLLAGGDEVVALVRDIARAEGLAVAGAHITAGDVTDLDSIKKAMEGADGVFHVAGWYRLGVKEARVAWAINVDGTRNVLEAMRDLAIPRGVYTSTLAVNSDTHGSIPDERYQYTGPHLSLYDRTKSVAHYEVAEPMIAAGLPLVMVQPGAVYGVGDVSSLGDLLRSYLRRRLTAVPAKSGYCWGHVEDTARGHILAMQRGTLGHSYIIAGPPHTIVDALGIAETITGIPAPRMHVPPGALKGVAAVIGALERLPVWPKLPAEQTAEYLRVAAGVTYWGSNAKAKQELGYEPRSLEEGFREVLPEELRRLGGPR